MSGLKDGLRDFVAWVLERFDTLVTDAETVLTGDLSGSWDQILALSNIIKPFCLTIIGLCLLIELAQVAAKVDLLKWEHGLKVGVKMVLAKVCLDTAPLFLKACYVQANKWVASLSAGYQPIGTSMAAEVRALDTASISLGQALWLAMSMLLVVLGIMACGMVIKVIAYGRIFELYVYLAVSPIPCAFFPLGDGTGGGMSRVTSKFLKSFAAVCLQGVMMIVCIRVFNIVMGTTVAGQLTTILTSSQDVAGKLSDVSYTMLMGAVVLVMSITKCGSWAKSILDAM